MALVLGLAAAGFTGLGFMLQQRAAYEEPLGRMLRLGLLWDLARKPLWLVGIGALLAGQILAGLALSAADVAQVEPLLATNLLFALVIGRIFSKQNLTWAEWLGGLLASGGVAVFLVVGNPHGEEPVGPGSGRWLGAAVVLGVALLLVVAGRRFSLHVRAMLLALGAGMFFGVQDALVRGVLLRTEHGFGAIVVTWQPYVLVAVALVGFVLVQSAFDAAPLRVSLPAATVAEPLAGIVLGVVIFDEQLRVSPGPLAAEVIGLTAMVVGIVILGHSPYLAKADNDEPPTGTRPKHPEPVA
jgi:drug/metabolite transporter (DMT)-like permease